ncbi:expressed unknown protein [Ectocarpus siliculosus]|uniref:Uncharacterized protein n=1 Tax=Ectocarpus siliculosus TaxID=2880 RepID=D8LEX8_ECTSI|nr:expressed unknown protein [Ectocarpus siliculosus]|eukprot:CBN79798.1 expressed unknown protein [Ectocarpus siliculosus]
MLTATAVMGGCPTDIRMRERWIWPSWAFVLGMRVVVVGGGRMVSSFMSPLRLCFFLRHIDL